MIKMISSIKDSEPPTALYVSDDPAYVNIVRRNLGHSGFSVIITKSAADAVEMVSDTQFDVILSDYNLPQMDALALLALIKEKSREEAPPMLVIADQDAASLKTRCAAGGAACLHAKMESVELLIERVTSMIRSEAKRDRIVISSSRRRFQGGTDPVTQVATKEHFVRRLKGESVAAYRDQTHLSLLMIVIDNYVKILDQHGRSKAQGALAQAARLIEGELRCRDCVARWGDHTFAVVLPETNLQAASAVGRRLRARMESTEFGDLDFAISMTPSIGAANRPPGRKTDPDEIVIQALNSAIAAQKMGGNRVLADNVITGYPLVLVVGDPSCDTGAIARGLEQCDVEVRMATSLDEARRIVKEVPVAMVVAESNLPGSKDSVELLRWVRNRFPEIKRVLLADQVDSNLMSDAVNQAAIHYFILLPSNLGDLKDVVQGLLIT
jgi:diguanylate cyclase (GGDEF)-like protein